MLERGQESNRGNGWSFPRGFFEGRLEEADGDVAEAIKTIDDPFSALAFVFGYMDKLSEAGVDASEAHRHAAAKIYGNLRLASDGDTVVLTEKHALWAPVLEVVNLKQELGSRWESVRDAVHFLDQADEQLLRGGLELF